MEAGTIPAQAKPKKPHDRGPDYSWVGVVMPSVGPRISATGSGGQTWPEFRSDCYGEPAIC